MAHLGAYLAVARSGVILTEIPDLDDDADIKPSLRAPSSSSSSSTPGAAAEPAPAAAPPPPLAASCTLKFRDDFRATFASADGKCRLAGHPSLSRDAQAVPFLALLGVIQISATVHCLVVVREHEAVSYGDSIFRITKVALHRIGSYELDEEDDEDGEDAGSGAHGLSAMAAAAAAASSSPSSTATASSSSSSSKTWAATFSSAAATGLYGMKVVGITLKSSISAVVPPGSASPGSNPDRTIHDIETLLSSGYFYHSDRDLTRPIQATAMGKWDWQTLNTDYAWNHFLIRKVPAELRPRVTPIIQGHVSYLSAELPSPHRMLLIARRSCRRGGRRYLHRGLDHAGHAANSVEIEQIVISTNDESIQTSSFVQFRGSVPLVWTQSGLSPKPDIVLSPSADAQRTAMREHFARQLTQYGAVRIVNLLESAGREGALSDAYRDTLAGLGLDRVQYTEFDFHRECAGLRFENVAKLIELLAHDLDAAGYYWTHERPGDAAAAGREPVPLLRQTGVLRTNCLDCLDRTNVVQTYVARCLLETQLKRMGIELDADFERRHALAWASLGDSVSRCYTGTDALKADFTRTGKRNVQGAAQDLRKSVERLYMNNVRDTYDQAIMDVLLGNRSWLPDAVHFAARELLDPDEAVVGAWAAKEALPFSLPSPVTPVFPPSATTKDVEDPVMVILTSRSFLVRPAREPLRPANPIPLNAIREMQVVPGLAGSNRHGVKVVTAADLVRHLGGPLEMAFVDLDPLVVPPSILAAAKRATPAAAAAGAATSASATATASALLGRGFGMWGASGGSVNTASSTAAAAAAPAPAPPTPRPRPSVSAAPSPAPAPRRGGGLFKRAFSAFSFASSPSSSSRVEDSKESTSAPTSVASETKSVATTASGGAAVPVPASHAAPAGPPPPPPPALADLIAAVQETALRELGHVVASSVLAAYVGAGGSGA
ncbi:hypothetical protein H9P43_003250 [Blastocladiella emersonii ATCC 22665]|nr:hypothetical protein H9P43_003250 [Blastocladiella emersonii ATCC 22665]